MLQPPIFYQEDDGQGSGGSGEPPASPTTPPSDPPADGAPGPIPYERFKQVNDELGRLKDQLAQVQEAQKKARDTELAEQQKWQELAEKREAELNAERLARTRIEVAAKKGIPPDLASRLMGDTAEAMEQDADNLLKFLKGNEGPGVPPAGKGKSPKPLDLSKMSPEEIRKNKEKIWAQEITG